MPARLVWCVFAILLVAGKSAYANGEPYYLALGDSLAIGIQPDVNGDLVPTDEGYVDRLYAFYRTRIPGLRLMKLGCSGETTTSMIDGASSPCTYAAGSQLSEAIGFIATHNVVLITLNIGAANLLQCLNLSGPIDPVCVAGATETAALDLVSILANLQAVAGAVPIVGANYYDPFLAAWVFGPAGRVLAIASLPITTAFNSALDAIYESRGVPVADVATTFRIQRFPVNVFVALTWTWMGARPPRGPDVHPNALGYLAIAAAFAKEIGIR
jgi:lysophospholipase L1-like esterase